jgi:hypothetical protein
MFQYGVRLENGDSGVVNKVETMEWYKKQHSKTNKIIVLFLSLSINFWPLRV